MNLSEVGLSAYITISYDIYDNIIYIKEAYFTIRYK